MENQSRRRIYLISFILFAILATGLILVAQGYHFDFKKKTLFKAGIVTIDSNPEGAEIYINNELRSEKTPAVLKDIPAGEHMVMVKKKGFYDIEKRITVDTENVNRTMESLELFLSDPPLDQISSQNVENFEVSTDQSKIIYFTKDPQKLFLLDLNKNQTSEITALKTNLDSPSILAWSKNNQDFLLGTSNNMYYLYSSSKKTFTSLALTFRVIKKAEWHPKNDKHIYLLGQEGLYLLDSTKEKLSGKLVLANTTGFVKDRENIYCSTNNGSINNSNSNTGGSQSQDVGGQLWKLDSDGTNKQLIIDDLLDEEIIKLISRNKNSVFSSNDQLITLTKNSEGKTTLAYTTKDNQKKALIDIDKNVIDFILSEDQNEIIYHKQNELYSYDVQSKEIKLITRLQEKIEQISIHPNNNQYLYLKVANSLRIIDKENWFPQTIYTSEEETFPKTVLIDKENYFILLGRKTNQYGNIYELNPQGEM